MSDCKNGAEWLKVHWNDALNKQYENQYMALDSKGIVAHDESIDEIFGTVQEAIKSGRTVSSEIVWFCATPPGSCPLPGPSKK